jgi:alcohol dehydrogenase
MVALIGAGVIDFSFLEHQTFPLAEVNEALSSAGDRPGGFSNVVVCFAGRASKIRESFPP